MIFDAIKKVYDKICLSKWKTRFISDLNIKLPDKGRLSYKNPKTFRTLAFFDAFNTTINI